jgi:hypothetical protein
LAVEGCLVTCVRMEFHLWYRGLDAGICVLQTDDCQQDKPDTSKMVELTLLGMRNSNNASSLK